MKIKELFEQVAGETISDNDYVKALGGTPTQAQVRFRNYMDGYLKREQPEIFTKEVRGVVVRGRNQTPNVYAGVSLLRVGWLSRH